MPVNSLPSKRNESNRVITYNLQQPSEDEIIITLMAIYDKSDIDNVSDAYLRSLVQEIEGK